MIARDVDWSGCDHIRGQAGSGERRVQTLRGRRSGIGFKSEQVRDRIGGRREFQVRSIHNAWRERRTASHANGLRAMMSLLAASAAGDAGLRAAEIVGARQFVAGVVDHFIRANLRRGVGTETVNLPWKNHHHEQQESF